MVKVGLIILAVFLSLTLSAYAQIPEMPVASTAYLINLNAGPSPNLLGSLNSDKDIYNNCPISKAGDGALNTVSAWIDIPKGISNETEETNLFLGLTLGLGKGLMVGLKREAAGIVDVTTCGFPPYDKPLMNPEYKVNHPDRDGLKIKILRW